MLHQIYSYARLAGRAATPASATDEQVNPLLRWRPERPQQRAMLTVAELAECRCPDLCDRDHANE